MYTPTKWEDHVSTLPGIVKILVYDEAKNFYRISEAGEVMVQGTPQDQTNFNNMEAGILDAHTAISLLLNYARQLDWDMEGRVANDLLDQSTALSLLLNYARQNAWSVDRGTVTLTNSSTFPFNNSRKTVALGGVRDSTDYVVLSEIVSANGNPGEIEVTDKLDNGFKLGFTGSAKSVTVNYTVFGGDMK